MSWRDRAIPADDTVQPAGSWRDRAIPADDKQVTVEPSKTKQRISEFLVHPLIEGGAMTVGGLAGATLGAPAGPVAAGLGGAALATAMYPPAKRAAEGVDRLLGLTPAPQEPLLTELGQGAAIEAGGRALQAGAPLVKPLFRAGAKRMAKLGQTISGARAGDLMQAYEQGLKTYAAPGMAKAGESFEAAAKAAGIEAKPTLEAALDPALSTAKQVAMDAGKKLESGVVLDAQEALYARQAVDRIIAGTPGKDKATLRALSELRGHFDDALTQASPAMKEASTQYRKSIVKSNLLKPFPVNKSGEYSRLHSLLTGLASGVLGFSQHDPTALFKGAAILTAASPMSMGLGATLSGEAAKATSAAIANPAATRMVVTLTADKAREFLKRAKGDKDKARKMATEEGWTY